MENHKVGLKKRGMKKLYFNNFDVRALCWLKKTIRILIYYTRGEKRTLRKKFKERHGYNLNVEAPKTLNEKIQWLKINERKHLQTVCADKLAVRDFIKVTIGDEYLIPLLKVYSKDVEINNSSLPKPPYILKSNHNSGDFEIVRHELNSSEIVRIKRKYAASLVDNFFYRGGEWQYKDISPCIIAEQLLVCQDGKIPSDYKIHCFNGKAKIIYLSYDREGEDCRNIYDTDWNILPFTWGKNLKRSNNPVKKPKNLEKMIELSEKLACIFPYVRVDFYDVDGKIYFGELTFHQGSGFDKINPIEWDEKMGNWVKLPKYN